MKCSNNLLKIAESVPAAAVLAVLRERVPFQQSWRLTGEYPYISVGFYMAEKQQKLTTVCVFASVLPLFCRYFRT